MGKYSDCAQRAAAIAEDVDADIPVRNPANAALYLFLR
jgi:hypothetical protein